MKGRIRIRDKSFRTHNIDVNDIDGEGKGAIQLIISIDLKNPKFKGASRQIQKLVLIIILLGGRRPNSKKLSKNLRIPSLVEYYLILLTQKKRN